MVTTADCGSRGSSSASTDLTVIPGSHCCSALVMRPSIWKRVATVLGSNRNRRSPAPNDGRLTRSRSSVRSTISIASRMLASPSDQAMCPSAPTCGGNAMPRPYSCPASMISSPLLFRQRQADLEKRHPEEDDVEQLDGDDQHDQRADGDD